MSLIIISQDQDVILPLMSAPAEKNLPSPVRTVKTVLGWSFSSRRALTVSITSFPPNELRAFGRLNCRLVNIVFGSRGTMSNYMYTLIIPIFPVISKIISLYSVCDIVRVAGDGLVQIMV